MRIFLGMDREEWDKVFNRLNGKGIVICTCKQSLHTIEAIRSHWQMGHFDTPVYKEYKE